MICKRVYYSGQVQGVGFRYTALQIAENYAVAGYVRNLPSGSVELVAEGDAGPVEAFLQAVANRMAGYIVECKVHEEAPGGYQGFQVKH